MLKQIKKMLLLLVALQVLNIGLFAKDVSFHNSNKDVNVINSATEYFAEVVLDFGNSFPEKTNHKHSHEHHKNHHNVHLKAFHIKIDKAQTSSYLFQNNIYCKTQQYLLLDESYNHQLVFEIIPHPPKA